MKGISKIFTIVAILLVISGCTSNMDNRIETNIESKNNQEIEENTDGQNKDKINAKHENDIEEKEIDKREENLELDRDSSVIDETFKISSQENELENAETTNDFILPDINETKKVMEKYIKEIEGLKRSNIIVKVIDNLDSGEIVDKTHEVKKSFTMYAYLCDLQNSTSEVQEARSIYDSVLYRIDARVEYYFDSENKLVRFYLDSGYRDYTINFSEEVVNYYQKDISALYYMLSFIQRDLEKHFSITRLDYLNPKKSYSNGELIRLFGEAGNMDYISYKFIPHKRKEILADEQIKFFITEGRLHYLTIANNPGPFILDRSITKIVNNQEYYLADKDKLTTYLAEAFTLQMCDKFFSNNKELFYEEEGQLYITLNDSDKKEDLWEEIVVKSKEPLDKDTIAVEVYLVYPGISKNSPPAYQERKFEFKFLEGQGWWLNSW